MIASRVVGRPRRGFSVISSGEGFDIDISEFREIPTYKRMCVCILKNDHACKYMGFALNKEEAYKRDKIMEQFKNMML